MDKKTEEILTMDVLAETEKFFGGKHWSEFNTAENIFSLVRAAKYNSLKEAYLKSIGDTNNGMSWTEFKQLITNKGFIPALEYDVQHDIYIDEFIIYYHPNKGLIICADSYFNKKVINSGTLYGEIQAHSKEDQDIIWKWISSGGLKDPKRLIYETSHDIREGLFSKLDVLESAGSWVTPWVNKDRFLWFVDYTDKQVPGYDYIKITEDKIAKCPDEFQKIIGRHL